MDVQHRATVVVGVDGSVRATEAVRWGALEAARRGVPVRLVAAVHGEADRVLRPELVKRYEDVLAERARAALADAAAVAGRDAPGVEVESELVTGDPVAVLRVEAERALVVVIGDRGLSKVEGLLAGSVSVALATHADCLVVVVRGREASGTATLPVVVGVDGSPVPASRPASSSNGPKNSGRSAQAVYGGVAVALASPDTGRARSPTRLPPAAMA